MQAMPLNFIISFHRDNPPDGPHGFVHLSAHAHRHPRTGLSLCGQPTAPMRSLGSPFDGWTDVLCPDCGDRLAL